MNILWMVLTRCLHALPDGIDVLLKTLYMYRYDFEHAEQHTGWASLRLSMGSRMLFCIKCLDKTATHTFEFLFMVYAFMRHEQFLWFECSTPLTTFVLPVRLLTFEGCIDWTIFPSTLCAVKTDCCLLWSVDFKVFLLAKVFSQVSRACIWLGDPIFFSLLYSSDVKHLKHHCVVIFFWSSGIIDCMFVYIWKWSSAHALGASVVLHLSLPLINSFNKTEVPVFSFRPCLRATLYSV